jgi:hypothetical protein
MKGETLFEISFFFAVRMLKCQNNKKKKKLMVQCGYWEAVHVSAIANFLVVN